MIQKNIAYWYNWLLNKNQRSFYLAFLRVLICIWLLKEVCINWASYGILYSPNSFVIHNDNHIMPFFPGLFSFIRSRYMLLIYIHIAIILLNIFGIGRWVTALALFLSVCLLQKLNMAFVNGGDMMMRFLLLYMVFANSYDYFVLNRTKTINPDKIKLANLVGNLAAFSIMLQLCVAYFCSGIAKLHVGIWRNGQAVYYMLSLERFTGTALNKYIAAHAWLTVPATYLTLIFELGFPFLIWIKKLKKMLMVTGIIFHLLLYIFLMIYGFQVVFIMLYGLFLTNEEWLKIVDKCKSIILRFTPGNSLKAFTVKDL